MIPAGYAAARMHALLLAVLAAASLPAHVLPGELRVEKLSNGVTVALVAFPANGVVAFDTLIRAGARDERDTTGVAHLVEHLLFRGTARVPEAELKRRLQALAVDANGETDEDYTLFSSVAPEGSLPELIQLEAERLQHARISAADVVDEAGSVEGEQAVRAADSEQALAAALQAATFRGRPHRHDPLGTAADIHNLGKAADAAQRFYAAHYRPEAVTLIVSGAFDVDAVLAEIARAYGGWRGAAITEGAPAKFERHTAVRVAGQVDGSAAALFGFSIPPAAHARQLAAAELIAELLGGPLSKLSLGPGEQIEASIEPRRDPSLLGLMLTAPDAARLAVLESRFRSSVEDLRAGRIDREQLEQVRRALLWNEVARLQTPAAVARALAIHAAATGRPTGLDEVFAGIRAIDVAEVASFARECLELP